MRFRDNAVIQNAECSDWLNLNRDLAATRYSLLTEIDTTNVS
jgi:glucose dehydrogenase